MIKTIEETPTHLNTNQPQYDMFLQIFKNSSRIKSNIQWRWVKSHQGSLITLDTILNDIADKLAKTYIASHIPVSADTLPCSLITVLCNKIPLTDHIPRIIQYEASRHDQISYICNKNDWTKENFEWIAWRNLQECMKKLPPT